MSEGNGGTEKTEVASLAVAVVALVVATVALVGTTAQVLQQYLATAVGYSNCGKRVMGPVWARHTKLVFHPWELRFEVVFSSPEISVQPRGPDDFERKDSVVSIPVEQHAGEGEAKTAVADYAATWLTLLSTVDDMEGETARLMKGPLSSSVFPSGWLVRVQVRAKTQTLDLMPDGVKKPYATTTFGDIINLAALTGMHWKQFDRIGDRYIAEGNGLLLTGSAIPHLGITFAFTRHGVPRFARTRVIPVAGVVELACGLVPTLWRGDFAPGPTYLTDVRKDLRTLSFGNPDEMSSSLARLRWDRDLIAAAASAEHLFPVLFEVVAMLARSFHIRRTPFRMLPNPLPMRWDYTAFSPIQLLRGFTSALQSVRDRDELVSELGELARPLSFRALLSELDHPQFDPDFLDDLQNAVDWCNRQLRAYRARQEQSIFFVLQSHVRSLVAELRSDGTGQQPQVAGNHLERGESLSFSQLRAVEPLDREYLFMQLYFDNILPRVRHGADGSVWGQAPEETTREEIWLVLVFRMVCWLNLHTFHPADVQIPKGDMMGSRQPVYIS